MNKTKVLIAGLVTLAAAGVVAAASGAATAISAICAVLSSIQTLLYAIAGGVGVVVITLQGIKWAGSAEDPGARKSAKQGIIHAVIGLIIVLLAVWIVIMVFSGGSCSDWTGAI
jgi:hypothetical protein